MTTATRPSRAEEIARLRSSARRTTLVDWVAAIGLLVVAWSALSAATGGRVPTPLAAGSAGIEILGDGSSYDDLWATLRRMCTAFAVAFAIGCATGGLVGTSPLAKAFFRPWIVVGMSAPMPVVVVVAVLIIGIGESSGQIALVVSVAPFVATIVGDAVAGHDRQLVELGRVLRLPWWERVRHVLVPQVAPALLAAARTGFALCWKLIVVVEALASTTGVGAQMQRDFKLLRTDRMMGWALVFMAVMKVVDLVVFAPVERRGRRWRAAPAPAGGRST